MIPTRARTIRRRIVIGWLPTLLLFVLGGSMAGCAGTPTSPAMTYAPAPPVTAAPAGPTTAAGDGLATETGRTMGHAMPSADGGRGGLDAPGPRS